jgi:trehalose 6-phosphate synthase
MARRRHLIVVSNRGPIGYATDVSGERVARRGGGGLVTALRGLIAQHDVTWIASAISAEDLQVAAGGSVEESLSDDSPYRLRLVAHDPNAYDWHYNVVSNPMLWFLQHYLWDLKYEPEVDRGFVNAWEQGYVPVNQTFAEAVLEELAEQPDAAVFFHDYHLYLAPRLVRERAPDAALMHFVHIPWAQPDYWRLLPERIRVAVHDGLLANDVIGFHTPRWRRNFLRCCEDIAGASYGRETFVVDHAGRRVRIVASAISVDTAEFEALARSEEVVAAEARLVGERPEQLVLRVDRTDPSKNIVRGFHAFELLLAQHPELAGRVQMLALLDPSRQDIPDYAEYVGAVQRAARAVNDRFRRPGWEPLVLRVVDDFPGSVAAYKQFDVLLVNAIFDGLNLVAKEAPLVNERDGVVVLSENAGAHEELGHWALTVNPFDVDGQASALWEALTMPVEERRRRLAGIRTHIRRYDLAAWLDGQLDELEQVHPARPRRLARLRRR